MKSSLSPVVKYQGLGHRCGGTSGRVELGLETTRSEIVQVSSNDFDRSEPQVEACLSESVVGSAEAAGLTSVRRAAAVAG